MFLPPVHSPLTLRALLSGVVGMAGGDARAEVAGLLGVLYHPEELVLTDSGTSALALAIRASIPGEGTRLVALPAWGCYDLATATLAAGARAVLYDLDPLTLGPDPDSLSAALEAGAGAVVVAHFYGVPADVPAVTRLAQLYGAVVIEDAAQGGGVEIGGRPAGSVGAWGILSFGRGKGWTGGGGGALLANSVETAARLAEVRGTLAGAGGSMVLLAKTLAQWILARPGLYALPASLPFLGLGETVFRPPHPAGRMSPAAAGIIRRTWSLQDPEIRRRRENARAWAAALVGTPGVTLLRERDGHLPGWLRFPVLLESEARARAASARARRLGVMPGYPGTLADLEPFRGAIVNRESDLRHARNVSESLFTLPTHGFLRPRARAATIRLLSPLPSPGPAQ